ncbi:MAG: sigma-70 family RNA polymerase sigma factor [Hyphomicrobiales bacterium]|nr:sigma-70 family RNA polymerase sigma factor [Hyphomicrobiales bacterium]
MGSAASQGATDLALLRAVIAQQRGAWAQFVRHWQRDIYAACRLAFPDEQANDAFLQIVESLRANDFALLRAFDGRAPFAAYLRLALRDLLSQRLALLLSEAPERGWRAFEHFFKRDILRIIARYCPAAEHDTDDAYHDIVASLIEDGYRRIRAYDGHGSFGGFVLRTVANLCIDRLRKDVPRRRLPAAIKYLSVAEQEVFRQLYWRTCPEHRLDAALRGRGIELDAAALGAAVAAVREALPRGIEFRSEDRRSRLVTLPDVNRADEGGAALHDERPTPEEEAIARQHAAALEQASDALRSAVDRLPPDVRLYLQHVMDGHGERPAREIARLMGRPVSEVYRLKQQAEHLLREALADHPAVKNLRMTV